MTFCSTSVANTIFDLNKCALDLLLEWKSGLYGLLSGSYSSTGLDRSDRLGVTGLTGLVRLELLRLAMNHVPFFLHPKHTLFSRSFL